MCGRLFSAVAVLSLVAACSDEQAAVQSTADAGAGGSTATGGASGTGGASQIGGNGGGGGAAGSAGAGGAPGSGGSNATGGASGTGATPGVDPPCDATCHYVNASTGRSGDGSSWNDPWMDLPATLERGHRYFLGPGDYATSEFDDAPGATISIIRATSARHGSDVGWQDSIETGAAVFGSLRFTQPGYVMDGSVPGGFRTIGNFQGSVVSVEADDVTLRRLDIDGYFRADSTGQHDRGACTGLDIGGDRVTIAECEIHDVADDGVSASGVTGLHFNGNHIHALHACGTDGGCGPCYNGHSDGIETYNVKSSEFVGNFVHDVRSTATFFFGNWADSLGNGPSEYCEDILLANNVLYAPEVGLVAYIQDAARVDVYHNVFWGLRQGGYGGLSIGPNVTGLRLYNNVILSINTDHTGGAFNAAEHDSNYNLFGADIGQWTIGSNDLIRSDPEFVGIPGATGAAVPNPTALDFALQATSPAVDAGFPGSATIVLPATDYAGRARSGAPDVGAFER